MLSRYRQDEGRLHSHQRIQGRAFGYGRYDANPEMMQAWVRPEDYEYSSWWNPSWGTTGDGHMMGLSVGAEMDSLPQPS